MEPTSLDFGTLPPLGTATLSVVVRNSSKTKIVLSSETITGVDAARFIRTSPPVTELRVGEDATVTITFTAPPTPNTLARAELVFESDAINARLSVLLVGASGAVEVDAGMPERDAGTPEPDAGTPPADAGRPDAGCRPRTCRQANAECGMVSDLCGGELLCGECHAPEVCGLGGRPNVCGAPATCSGPAPTVPAPSLAGPSSTCALRMPPAAGIPCEISTPGTQYYVSSSTGDDNNDGLSPTTPWATLHKALCAAAPGGTVRVTEGTYLTTDVVIARPLTVKGGYDTTFSTWNPDVHHSILAGRPTLSDDGAVLGGFRIIRQSRDLGAVIVKAGKLVRNYIELLMSASPIGSGLEENWHTSYGIVAAAETGKHVTIACNDIYGRSIPSSSTESRLTDLIELGNVELHNGHTVIDSNRACLDSYSGSNSSAVIGGYGSCEPNKVATVTITNNILEGRTAGTWGMAFYGCEYNLSVVATNNTVLATQSGVYTRDGADSNGNPVPAHWRLTNNIFGGLASPAEVVDLAGTVTRLVSTEGNLVFGYGTNSPATVPAAASSNDFSGSASLSSTFVDWANGDFRPLPAGPAASGGVNVWGQGLYGNVTGDVRQQGRPDAGSWARGALLP